MEEWTNGWMGELDALSGMRRSAADTTNYSVLLSGYCTLYMAFGNAENEARYNKKMRRDMKEKTMLCVAVM